jgi:hypothetical protein
VTKNEINYLKTFINDDESIWELIKTQKKKNASMNSYFSNQQFFPKIPLFVGLSSFKMSILYEVPFEKCVDLVI